MDINTPLFYDTLKSSLAVAHTLEEAEKIIQQEIEKIVDYKIGFVVGKVTPINTDETKSSNLSLLGKRTREIAEKEVEKGIMVFSSSIIPEFIESSTHADAFYAFWEHIVQKYVTILYTTPGYVLSKGAASEIALAQKMGKEIMSYEEIIKDKN